MIQNLGHPSKNGKRNWVSALLSSEMYYLSIEQGLTLSHMKIFWCSFKYFEQCMIIYTQAINVCQNLRLFSNPSIQMYVFGAQKNCLIKTVL